MAELSRQQKARLGAFVVFGVVLLAGSIAVLAGLSLWDTRHRYTVRYQDSVSGLEPSAAVKYQGLRIGNVEDMRIAPDDPSRIEVTLAIDPAVRLYPGAMARLDANGLTGLKSINVINGDPRGPPLKAGSELTAGSSAIDEITNKAAEIARRLEVVATQLSLFMSEENRVRIEKLLDGLTVFTATSDHFLAKTEQPFVEALRAFTKTGEAATRLANEGTETLQVTTHELAQTMQALRRPIAEVDPKDVAAAVKQARFVLFELERGLEEAKLGQSMQALYRVLQRFDRLALDLDLAVTASRQDFTMSLAYLREATENLREFSRTVAQDPSVLLRGREMQE